MRSIQRPLWLALLTASSCVLPEYTKDLNPGLTAAGGAAAGSVSGGGANTSWSGSWVLAGGNGARGGTTPTSNSDAAGRASGAAGVSTLPLGGGTPLGGVSPAAGADTSGGTGGGATVTGTSSPGGSTSATGAAGSSGSNETGGVAGGGAPATGGWTNVPCPADFRACRSPTCDTQISSDTNNCGACGNVCTGKNAATWTCEYACKVGTCDEGFSNCNGLHNDGCEVDLKVPDQGNCGTCGKRCINQPCGNHQCDSICGKRDTDTTATCFQAALVGSDTDFGYYESYGSKWLIGVRRTLGEYPEPTLVAMGVVEKEGQLTPVKYTLGLYDSDDQGEPRNLIWQSPLQTAAGSTSAPRTNIVQLQSPTPLVANEHYWQMVLVYDPISPTSNASLLIATAGENSAGQERIYGYGHGKTPASDTGSGITTMPNALSGAEYQDLSRGDYPRKAPAIFMYVAHP